MTPTITSMQIIERIEVLDRRLKKQNKGVLKFFRKKKIQDTKERLELNWKKFHNLYEDLIFVSGINDVKFFKDMISYGILPNRFSFDTYNSRPYDIGSKEYEELVEQMMKKRDTL